MFLGHYLIPKVIFFSFIVLGVFIFIVKNEQRFEPCTSQQVFCLKIGITAECGISDEKVEEMGGIQYVHMFSI